MSKDFTQTARAGRLRALAALTGPRRGRPTRKPLFSALAGRGNKALFAS